MGAINTERIKFFQELPYTKTREDIEGEGGGFITHLGAGAHAISTA